MKSLHFLLFCGVLLLHASCSGIKTFDEKSLDDCPLVGTWKQVGTDSIMVLDVGLIKDTMQIRLSQLVDGLEIIKLETRDTALVKPGYMVVSDRYMLLGSYLMPYKLFDKNGTFLHQIGGLGQGPGEYTNIYDAQIDEVNNRIYMLPWTSNQLLVFDLDGNLLPPIPLPARIPKGVFRVDTKKNRLTMGILPFRDLENELVLWQQDLKGNVLQSISSTPYYTYDDYSNEVSSNRNAGSFDFFIFNWSAVQDSLYHYDTKENRLVPVFTANFGTQDIPKHTYTEFPGHYWVNIITEVVNGQGMPPMNILIDKYSLKGTYCTLVIDELGGIPVEYPYDCFQDGRFLMNLDPGDLIDELEKVLAKPERFSKEESDRLTKLKNSISVDDNNYILVGKLKSKGEGLILSAIPVQEEPTQKQQPAKEELIKTAVQPGVASEADTVWSASPYSAELPDAINYFRTHNKYKDWDPKKGKRVLVHGIAEKDGTISGVGISYGWDLDPQSGAMKNKGKGTCGLKELDEEALRLIRQAKLSPGMSDQGVPVRSNFVVIVDFPPK